jgi:3-hydroxyisobutyrate dehydrogenase-like beta-hydroxyacid dehydrogenase
MHPVRQSRQRIGVIGLGRMGRALATSLLAEGFPVCCHDISPDAIRPVLAEGAVCAPHPRAVARSSDLVITFLPGPSEVTDVALNAEHGVLAGLRPGALMLDMSTCGPDTAALLGTAFDRAGHRFVDCPVSRKAPDMTVLVGGTPGVLGDAADVLDRVSRTVIYCGFRGAGYATKLLNQHVKYAWYLASAEALVLARQFGLDPDVTASAIEQSSGGESGFSTAAKYFRDDTDGMLAHAPASTIEKDMDLAEAMAATTGVRCPTLDVTADFFTAVGTTPFRDLPYPRSCEVLADLRIARRHVDRGTDTGS